MVMSLKGKRVVDVSCGGYHTVCIVEQNDSVNLVYSWGNGYYGQLGNGETADTHSPVQMLISYRGNEGGHTRQADLNESSF